MQKEINLEEVLVDEAKKDIGDYKWVDFEEVYKEKNLENLQRFVIEFGRRVAKDVLELAAKNAELSYTDAMVGGCPECMVDGVNKQSITDTINQVK